MAVDLLQRLGMTSPVVQAGMGGRLSRHELAAAVAEAGGLGTIHGRDARLAEEIAAARALTGGPIAVNVLLPFARPAQWQAAQAADAVVTFWGRPRRRHPGVWIHQCGSVDEARAAAHAGADGVIAQGVEAGGHVRGRLPALELLAAIRQALPGLSVLVAGGLADRSDVARVLEAGAVAAVLGTRFLASDESHAHPGYKQRLVAGRATLLTELFGAGWPAAPHRVLPNAATARWLDRDGREPAAVRVANRALSPLLARAPAGMQGRALALQRTAVPLFSPAPPADHSPSGLLDTGPLYAGESVARIDAVRPAGPLVAALTP
jgi:nitronate monooxygenase